LLDKVVRMFRDSISLRTIAAAQLPDKCKYTMPDLYNSQKLVWVIIFKGLRDICEDLGHYRIPDQLLEGKVSDRDAIVQKERTVNDQTLICYNAVAANAVQGIRIDHGQITLGEGNLFRPVLHIAGAFRTIKKLNVFVPIDPAGRQCADEFGVENKRKQRIFNGVRFIDVKFRHSSTFFAQDRVKK